MAFNVRSLAIFRITLGLLVFWQGLTFAPDTLDTYFPHRIDSPKEWASCLMDDFSAALLLFPLLLATGFITRYSTALCLIGIILEQNADPMVLQGGDVLLRILLFWSLFLPVEKVWSVDAWLGRGSGPLLLWTTRLATWALTLQVCFVYWFAALLKSDPLWTQNGNALFYALNLEHFSTPLGLYLRQYPDLLRIITLATPWFELVGPCLLFAPFNRDICRMAAVTLFLGFHLIGMEMILRIGLFPWVCATAWLIFIPQFFWDWLEANVVRLFRLKQKKRSISSQKKQAATIPRTQPILDGVCSAFVVLSFLDVLAWNVASLGGDRSLQWMQRHDKFGTFVRLDQRWNMYAPRPRSEHGWLVIPADLSDGSQVDLFTGRRVSWDKPADIGAYFGDDRQRRYISNLFDDKDPEALQKYADYLVRRWNDNHSTNEKVQAVTIVFMRQETQPNLTVTPPQKDILYFHGY